MSRFCNVKSLVLVIGDSHVFWLKQFIVSSDVRVCPGTSVFEAQDCRVKFAGYRGGTTRSLSSHSEIAQILDRELPRVAVLSVGANDIDTPCRAETLKAGMRLYELAKTLIRHGVERVVVCQVVRRQAWRHITVNEGSQRVQEMNEFLKSVCHTNRISFWAHKGFWASSKNIFRRDQIHLNDHGNYKLWRSVKGAVFLAVKGLHR